MNRTAQVNRKTRETDISLSVDLDGRGTAQLNTGVGFFDHMLELFARHSMIDLSVTAKGDLHVDAHHTVEDVGIVLGQAIAKAVGDKAGIHRYGSTLLPMDETLVQVAIDLSGRPVLVFRADFPSPLIGDFPTELVEEFFRGFANSAAMNLHISLVYGSNSHHIAEAIFKATARALRMALSVDPRQEGMIPSTKGAL